MQKNFSSNQHNSSLSTLNWALVHTLLVRHVCVPHNWQSPSWTHLTNNFLFTNRILRRKFSMQKKNNSSALANFVHVMTGALFYFLMWKLEYEAYEKSIIFINSLAPGKFKWNFRQVIFKMNSVIDGWGISCEFPLTWMSLDLTDDKSTLVQVMAWCRQATSHYLNQCWPRSPTPYGVTRPQWVNQWKIPSEMVPLSCQLVRKHTIWGQ